MSQEQIPIGAVKRSLKAGNTTAEAIRCATRLSIVSVYMALVWLEARGHAYLTCERETVNSKYFAQWEAA